MHQNLPAMLADRARRSGDHPALRYQADQRWLDISYAAMDRSVQAVARGLLAEGLQPGDRVGIMSWNRPSWSIVDFAILRAGGVVVPIYPTSTPEQVAHIANDAGLQILFVGGAQELTTVRQANPALPDLLRILVFAPDAAAPATGHDDFTIWAAAARELPGDEELAARQAAIAPDDLATIIYTSGTTGEPKGVMLSHANIFHQIRAVNDRFTLGPSDRSLCFLPLSHVFERTWTYYILHQGATNCYLENPRDIVPAMAAIKPTAMTGVPRLYEKIHATMHEKIERGSAARRRLFEWSLRIGRRYHEAKLRGAVVDPYTWLRYRLADLLVLRRIRAVVGGRKNFFAAGGAPLAREIEEMFLAAGLLVCQGYGLTETSPMITCNSSGGLRFGTVGRPVCECEVRIGEQDEVQVRGPNVMLGYWNRPVDTAAAFTADGWLKTGDVGALDPDGFLRITDRLKDLIITSYGKNIAPASIEMHVGKDHYIEQIAVVGDGQRFLGALILPSFEALETWAADQRIRFADRAELLRNHRVVEFIRERIERQSQNLASWERIRRFHLLEQPFNQLRGEITPTLKIKRRVIQEHYKEIIARLFQSG
jgi:long-chain acyl-CoA synthetase